MGESLGVTSRLVTAAELDDEELARCVALLTEAFQVWPSQETRVSAGEYLRWKLEMPGPLASQMHLLEMGEELVALGVYQARGYRLFGKRYGVVDGEDAAVHPAHQGEGLYGRRRVLKAELVDPDFDFTVNFTRNPRVLTYRRKRGRAGPEGRPRVLRRINDARRTAWGEGRSSWLRPQAFLAIVALRWWQGVRFRPAHFERTWELREASRFDERVDGLFERAAAEFDFVQERGAEWLNWRYADPRNGLYRIVVAEEAAELLGYVVFRESRGLGFVLDLLVLPGRSDVATSLLEVAVVELAGCETVSCWLTPGHPYGSVVRGQGFMGPARETGMLVRSISVDEALFDGVRRNDGRAHVMLGDSDWM